MFRTFLYTVLPLLSTNNRNLKNKKNKNKHKIFKERQMCMIKTLVFVSFNEVYI